MAYSYASISANEAAALAANKPVLLAENVLDDYLALPQWRTGSANGAWASTDTTDASYPTRRAFDRYLHRATKPTGASNSTFYLLFELNSVSFDTLIIAGHNFHDYPTLTLDVTLQVANNSAFSSALTDVAQWASITYRAEGSRRLVWYLSERWSGVQYARLKIAANGNFNIATPPSIGEMVLGNRLQLSSNPNTPWDAYGLSSDVPIFSSKSGIDTAVTRSAGRRIARPEWSPSSSDLYSMDDAASLRSWYRQTGSGARPFAFCLTPATAPETTYWMRDRTAGLSMPYQGPSEKIASFEWHEQPPFVEAEAV